MNLAWEVVLKAMEEEMDAQNLHFHPSFKGSPYSETAFAELNNSTLMSEQIDINPLYRFAHIFGTLFDVNLEQYPRLREMIFDVFMHYQSQLDLRSGITKSEYYVRAILKDILSGVYGQESIGAIRLFSNVEAKNVLHCMLNLFRCGTSMDLFRQVMRAIYSKAIIYRNTDIYREILIYLPVKKNDIDLDKMRFLISMFLDINYTVYVFWGYHFGIIGVNETLAFEEMILF